MPSLPQPVGNPREWKLTASHNPSEAKLAADGKFDTRWSSKADQAPGQWIQVELPQEATVGGLWLDAVKSSNDYPRGYKVEVSADGESWSKPVAQGNGTAGVMEITFPPVKARFIRLTQTGKLKPAEKNLFWSVNELQVLQPTGK